MTDTAPAIDALLAEHADLERQLSDPALHSDAAKARKVGRRFAALAPIVATSSPSEDNVAVYCLPTCSCTDTFVFLKTSQAAAEQE